MIRAALSPRSDVGRIVASVDTDHAGHQDLWWETTSGNPVAVPERLDAVAVALVTKAMNFGQDLHLEGRVSWTLLANLEEFVEAWTTWRPDIFRPVRISAAEVVDDRADGPGPNARRTVLAASGGVDSTYALHAHARGLLGHRSLEVADAVLIQGFDIPLDADGGWRAAHRSVTAMAEAVGVTVVGLRTNWRAVADPEWEMSFGTALAACLLLFTDRAAVATVAADCSYGHLTLPWGSNAITQPLLASAAMRVAYIGGGSTRTGKCAVIGEDPQVRRHIRVCWEGPDVGRNCGRCEKCQRTKLNFAAAGHGTVEALGPVDVEGLRSIDVRSVAARDLYRELVGETARFDTEVAEQVQRLAHSDVTR